MTTDQKRRCWIFALSMLCIAKAVVGAEVPGCSDMISLSGSWRLALDPGNVGVALGREIEPLSV